MYLLIRGYRFRAVRVGFWYNLLPCLLSDWWEHIVRLYQFWTITTLCSNIWSAYFQGPVKWNTTSFRYTGKVEGRQHSVHEISGIRSNIHVQFGACQIEIMILSQVILIHVFPSIYHGTFVLWVIIGLPIMVLPYASSNLNDFFLLSCICYCLSSFHNMLTSTIFGYVYCWL